MSDDDKKPKPKSGFEDRMSEPMGLGPGGTLLIFNSLAEARQWEKDHPPIIVDPDDEGEVPDDLDALRKL